MFSSDIDKVLNTPPLELLADDMIFIRCNGFIRKNYFIRWEIKDDSQLPCVGKDQKLSVFGIS